MKWKQYLIYLILIMALAGTVIACKEIYKPNENVTVFDSIESTGSGASCNMSLYNGTQLLYDLNISMEKDKLKYFYDFGTNLSQGTYRANIECCSEESGNCTDIYLSECNFIVEGDDELANLSVTIFVLLITGVLFVLGIKGNFTKSPVANLIGKRVCVLLGLFLMSLNTTIIITIADNAGLGLERILFRYLWIVNWSIYLFMVYIVWTTVVNVLKLMAQIARNDRMGGDEDFGKEFI